MSYLHDNKRVITFSVVDASTNELDDVWMTGALLARKVDLRFHLQLVVAGIVGLNKFTMNNADY